MKGKAHAGYLPMDNAKLKQAIRAMSNLIRSSGIRYDGIVGRGLSGAVIIPILALMLKKPFAIVRKNEQRHSSYETEVGGNMASYIVVDDLIDSGETIGAVRQAMSPANCAGIFLYGSYRDNTPHEGVPVRAQAIII